MDDGRRILLTNDDGIDSPGFGALYDALSEVGEVVGVAPADDRSAVGRSMSNEVRVHDHELGYAVEGTPADCVIAGLKSLCDGVDLVVSGCNKGANLGAYVLGRSGTVSAAVEAAFFGVPAIAVSQYVSAELDDWRAAATEPGDYRTAAEVTSFLAERAVAAGVFERADYLNVNAPWPGDEPAGLTVTRPSTLYDMDAARDGASVTLTDRIWRRMRDGDVPDPVGTDRRAVVDGEVSVSPLTAPHTTEHHEALDGLVAAYDP